MDRKDEALAALERAEQGPLRGNPRLGFNRAAVLEDLGRIQEAALVYRAAAETGRLGPGEQSAASRRSADLAAFARWDAADLSRGGPWSDSDSCAVHPSPNGVRIVAGAGVPFLVERDAPRLLDDTGGERGFQLEFDARFERFDRGQTLLVGLRRDVQPPEDCDEVIASFSHTEGGGMAPSVGGRSVAGARASYGIPWPAGGLVLGRTYRCLLTYDALGHRIGLCVRETNPERLIFAHTLHDAALRADGPPPRIFVKGGGDPGTGAPRCDVVVRSLRYPTGRP
jgi:hypothetical protein